VVHNAWPTVRLPSPCTHVVQLLGTSTQDLIQAAACSALSRVLRFRPQLVAGIAVSGGKILRKILEIHDPRLQARSQHLWPCAFLDFVLLIRTEFDVQVASSSVPT